MYRDNTLIPTEAIRLAALGQLVESDRPYSELAREVRQFVSLIVGPSLDMLGPSLELLCLRGSWNLTVIYQPIRTLFSQ